MRSHRPTGRDSDPAAQENAPTAQRATGPLHASPRLVDERARIGAAFGTAVQRQPAVVEESPLQARPDAGHGGLQTGIGQGAVPVNDDAGLEREADEMGARALAAVVQGAAGGARQGLTRATPGAVAQRVKTPVPRTFNHWHDLAGKDVQDHGKFFRAHLETLHWQMIQMKAQNTPEMTELNRLSALDDQALAQAEDEVVALVEKAPKTAQKSGYEQPVTQPLESAQQVEFAKAIKGAVHLATQTSDDDDVLALVFGKAQAPAAAANFKSIAQTIQSWGDSVGKKGKDDHVRLNSANAHYAAYCVGIGNKEASELMLGSTAFTVDRVTLIGTLIHEASHGALATSDLAYIGNAVFAKLNGTPLSLKNADHYKQAADLHATATTLPKAPTGVAVGIEEALQQGAQLCAYKCGKVKRLIDWTIPLYQARSAPHDVDLVNTHEHHMDLGSPARGQAVAPTNKLNDESYKTTTLSDIAVARSESFALALTLVSTFASTDKEITVLGNVVTCKAKTPDWEGREIAYDLGIARNPEVIAKLLFETTLTAFGVPVQQSRHLFDWHEALWVALLKSPHRETKYYQTDAEMQLYDILKG